MKIDLPRCVIAAIFAVALPFGISQAQNTPKVIAQRAADAIAQMKRSPGVLGDRCALGITFTKNNYVVSIYLPEAHNKFVLGDRILTVNDVSVEDEATFFADLARISPGNIARVRLERAGKTEEIEVQCGNSRPYTDARMRVLDAQKKKNWRECITAIRAMVELEGSLSLFTANAYLDCGAQAKELSQAQYARAAYEYWRLVITEGKWDPVAWPSTRGGVLSVLNGFEQMGQARLAADLLNQLEAADEMRSITQSRQVPNESLGPSSPVSSGTGFFVNEEGAILTSHHVVDGASQIMAKCGDNEPVAATVSATNQAIDIAVLSTGLQGSAYLSLGLPRSATVGQRIFTYGYPVTQILGSEPKFTEGTVSALSGIGGEQTYLQISVPVQPGNSGGPVVAESGEVIGIVAAGAAVAPFLKNTGTLPQNVNWAVKAEYAALMFDPPPPQPPARSREDAIARVAQSLCFIEVQ